MARTNAPYSSKDIALSLDIGDSTLRKWCLALEEQEYNFYRTDQNKRLFTEKDIIVLKHFQQLVKDKNMSMQNAALVVTSKFKKEPFSDETEIEQEMNIVPVASTNVINEELLNTLQEHIKAQESFNKSLLQRLEEQQNYIEQRLEQRDTLLMQSIRESQEVKQQLLQIATAQEEKKKRKGIFRFFSKD